MEWQTLETAHGTAVKGFPKCWVARTTPSTEFCNIESVHKSTTFPIEQIKANKTNITVFIAIGHHELCMIYGYMNNIPIIKSTK